MTNLARDLRLALDPAGLLRAAGLQPDPFQEAICRAKKDMLVLACRQGGKSTAAACAAAYQALYRPGSEILIIAPGQRQAVELLRKAEQFLRAGVPGIEFTSNSESRIELTNGSRLIALPSDPDKIRGYAADLVLIDEAARVPDELFFSAIRPMLAVSGGRIIALSTPDGPSGWFYHACMDGSEDWERIRIRAEQCPRIPATHLERERRTMTAAVYAAEYDCQFTDAIGSVFYSIHVDAAIDKTLKPLYTGGW
jgi:hypothetical protein